MAAPETENHLSVYRQFLKEFTSTVYPNDPLPVKVTGYILDEADLEGEIIEWTRQYLNQRSCPPALATSVARSVLGELQNVIKDYHELRSQGEEEQGPHYDPLRLMQAVVAKVRAVCERYVQDLEGGGAGSSGVLSIPPPLPGPPLVSTHAIKNHRRRMEDRHVSIEDLNALFGITTSPYLVGYYAIFDGHHGHEAAAYSAAHLHCLLVHSKHYPQDPEAALKDAFFRADEIFIKKCASSKFLSGTTALVALVRHQESLHVAWVGDSLGILVRKGGQISQFVTPHTAERQDERDRILSTGGSVFKHFGVWRINGTLAISRAIGDPECKPHVSALADVASYPLDGSEHFMILACDGLWDCVTEAHAAAFVYDHLRKEPENHADLSKLLVNLAKSRASNDNISVVVVLLSSVEDILASAPPPGDPALEASQEEEEEEDNIAAEASPADGLAPDGAPPCQLLVNGAMDVEAATAAADPSSNPFAPPFKGSPVPAVPGPDAPSPDGAPADEDRNNRHRDDDDRSPHDDDGLVMDYRLHHNHHNGHNNDIMTSSFYGNGGANGEDARHLFGDPSDLGPETDVDLLDDDGMMMDVGQAAEEEYKARALEFGVEDGLGGDELHHHLLRQHPVYPKEGDLLGAGDFSSPERADASPLLPKEVEEEEEGRMEIQSQDRPVHFNPFAAEGDWSRGKPDEIEEVDRIALTQYEHEPSTRQHYSDVDQHEDEVEVIPCKEESAVEKREVVPDEEGIEEGGGSGLEEAEDDSEEEGEWKYVPVKPSDGGAVVPEAISPEAALPDETSCSPALPEQDLLLPTLSPALPPRPEVVTPEVGEAEGFHTEAETIDFKAEELFADDDKFCKELGFEVVQKTHVEEVVCEPGLLEKPVEKESEPQAETEGVQEVQSSQTVEEELDDSTMESRLNPDAAEFVPISPTQNVNSESFSGFGNDFDTFKKEAEACPGEVSGEAGVASTPKSHVKKGMDEDSDTVLSSSFSHDVPRSSEMLQDELSPNVLEPTSPANDFHDDDDDKENIHQGEDKENMSQHITLSDVGSVLNRSFEVLEEHVVGNDKVLGFLGSPLNLPATESKDESEMASEPVDHGLMTDSVPEAKEHEQQLIQPELEHSQEIRYETSATSNIFSEAPIEPGSITQSEDVSISQSSDFILPEGDTFQQESLPGDDKRFSVEVGNVQQINDSLIMESGPEIDIPPAVEAVEQVGFSDHEETVPQITEEQSQPMPYPPVLQICPMKVMDVNEEHNLSDLSLDVGQEDLLVNQEHTTSVIDDTNKFKPDTPEPKVNIPVEVSMEKSQPLEDVVAELNRESVLKNDLEVEVEVQSVVSPSEAVCKSPIIPTTEVSAIIEESQDSSLKEKVSAIEEQFQKIEEEILKSLQISSENEMVQETITQNIESHVFIPSMEMVTSPEHVKIVDMTKEQSKSEVVPMADVPSSEPLVEILSKEVVEESIPEDASKAAVVGGAAAAVAAVAVLATAAVASSDSKPAAKKSAVADKKQVPDKSKLSSTATARAKSATKPPATAAKTSAPKKPAAPLTTKTAPTPAAPLTTKTAPTPAARTTITERKPAASTTKPAATTRPTTGTSLSSKPKAPGPKPATAPVTKVSAAPRTATAPSRPSTASSTAAKSGVTSSLSRPATSSPRPSTGPPKTTEVKKMLNGEASKPASASTTLSKTSPRKPTTTPTTNASKTAGGAKPLTTNRMSSASGKTVTETAAAKPRQSTASSAVNGAVPKTTRTSLGAGPKSTAPAPSRTKPMAPARGAAAPSAPGNAKKTKESVNKHISATRLSGVSSTAQKSADGKSLATKTSTKSPASASTKTMANGTAIKKPEVNLNSKKVEEKVELLISPHENGIAVDCNNEMRKDLDGVVGVEDGVHEVKEQMVLMGDALSIGEAV